MKKVSVVILNWNGRNWLEKFLPSVIQYTQNPEFEIIVADNFSTDDSISFLENNFPYLKLIKLNQNYGFTGGYNRALKELNSKYFMLLNSDIEVTEHWLDILYEAMEKDSSIGACQPKILSYNNKHHFEYAGASGGFIDKYGYPFCRGRIFDFSEKDIGQYNTNKKIFWATGACLLLRSDLFKKLNGLDEDYFAHMEEIDLCWRIQNLGYKIMVYPKSIVYHVGGGTLAVGSPRKTYFNFRNNLAMLYKNLPFPKHLYIVFIRLILDGLAGIQFLLKGDFKNFFSIIKAHFSFYLWLPTLNKKRKSISIKNRLSSLNGVYSKSIVFQFFIKKLKTFKELNV